MEQFSQKLVEFQEIIFFKKILKNVMFNNIIEAILNIFELWLFLNY